MRSAGMPFTQPVSTSYCQPQRQQRITVARSTPAARDDAQRMHASSIANIFPPTLNNATAVSPDFTHAPVPDITCSVDATSTKSDIQVPWRTLVRERDAG